MNLIIELKIGSEIISLKLDLDNASERKETD